MLGEPGGAAVIGPPKSAAARRTISIPVELADELSVHMQSLGLTGADPDELVFPNTEGGPLELSNSRRRVWVPAVKQAGVANLGHSDPRLTLAVYAQATTEGDRSAAKKLGARLMISGNEDAASSDSSST